METTRYRYRQMPDRLIDAVIYTPENAREVVKWALAWRYTGPEAEPGDLTVQCAPGERRRLRYGHWITCEQGTDRFSTCGAEAFDDYFEPA